jgi:hypothetical protein
MTKPKMKDVPYWTQYQMQRAMARKRNIEWHLTFAQWLEWWGDDIEYRGKHPTDLVMGRIDTNKPYQLDNLLKTTHADNISRSVRGVVTKKTRPCRTPIGDFVSVAEAARAYGHANATTVNRRLLNGHEGYEYLD